MRISPPEDSLFHDWFCKNIRQLSKDSDKKHKKIQRTYLAYAYFGYLYSKDPRWDRCHIRLSPTNSRRLLYKEFRKLVEERLVIHI